jgi:predicted extracellular nuclease
VDNLRAPDLLAVEEIQDNSGPADDGVVDASASYAALIAAIASAGGPAYDFR